MMEIDVDLDLGIREEELLPATLPAEMRGSGRDDARLLVTDPRGGVSVHRCFRDLARFLQPGDVLVLNDSATLPASIPARRVKDGTAIRLHLTPKSQRGVYHAEPRSADGRSPLSGGLRRGEVLAVEGGRVRVGRRDGKGARLWPLSPEDGLDLAFVMARSGRPIQYAYVRQELPLEAYQTAYAGVAGSSEMPSAGRAFTREMLADLAGRGVEIRMLTLHTSLSSHEVEGSLSDHILFPEPYVIPTATAKAIGRAMDEGRQIIAVGTTVVRALASAASAPSGRPRAGRGVARVMVIPGRRPASITGLLTGLHTPRSSHLALLEAFVEPENLRRAYRLAIEEGYRWHEFGDLQLILPRAFSQSV